MNGLGQLAFGLLLAAAVAPHVLAAHWHTLTLWIVVVALAAALALVSRRERRLVAMQRASQERYGEILGAADEGIAVMDRSGTVTYANSRAKEMFRQKELVGLCARDFLAPETAEAVEAKLAERWAGISESYELEAGRTDGTRFWLRCTARPMRDAAGEITGSVALLSDVTERVEREEAVRASEERYRWIVEAAHDVIWSCAPDGRITFVNRAVEALGYSPDELVGRPLGELSAPGEGAAVQAALEEVVGGTEMQLRRFELQRRDGSPALVVASAAPVYDREGRVSGVSGILTDITSRRDAERQRELAAQLIEISNEGVVAWDIEYRLTLWNPAIERLAGLAAAEVLGRNVFEAFPFVIETGEDEKLRATLRGEAPSTSDGPYTIPESGRQGFFDASYSPLRDDSGAIVGGIAVVSDVSERRAKEQALRDAIERFTRAFDDAPIGMALLDVTGGKPGGFAKVNQEFTRITGYHAADLLGRSWRHITFDDDAPKQEEAFARLLSGEVERLHSEKRYRRRDGSEVWVSASASVARDRVTRDALYIVKQVEDVTERRRAAEAMRSMVATITSAEDAIYTTDSQDVITSWNPAAERLYGFSADEAIGSSVRIIVPDRLWEAEHEMFQEARGGTVIRQWETIRRRKDGEELPVVLNKSPIRGPRGEVIGVSTIAHDIRARLATERERTRLEALLHQQQRLESLGQLAGGVAHDFNNLLAVIINYATFVEQEVDAGSSVAQDVREIRQAADQAAALTRQLLTFGRRDPGTVQAVDVNELIRSTSRMLDRLVEEHVSVETVLADALPPVAAGDAQVEQVMVNLVVNARDAMPDGGTIRLTTRSVELDSPLRVATGDLPSGSYVVLEVADEGTGVPDEVLEHLFEPFFTTKPKGKGTGLGLATVYGALVGGGGGVDVDTGAGGTTFSTYWPVAAAQAPADHPPAAADQGFERRTETVLLVEDEDAVRAVAERILRRAGFEVIAAASGREALERCRGGAVPVDAVLTDVVMPELSGPDVVRRLRELYGDLPVVFMSGYSDDVLVRHRGASEQAALVDKPFSAEDLVAAVAKALSPAEVAA